MAETPCKSYNLIMMARQNAHKGGKVDRADLKKMFYNSETTFTFENYITKLNGIFNVLDKFGVPLYKEKMV